MGLLTTSDLLPFVILCMWTEIGVRTQAQRKATAGLP